MLVDGRGGCLGGIVQPAHINRKMTVTILFMVLILVISFVGIWFIFSYITQGYKFRTGCPAKYRTKDINIIYSYVNKYANSFIINLEKSVGHGFCGKSGRGKQIAPAFFAFNTSLYFKDK